MAGTAQNKLKYHFLCGPILEGFHLTLSRTKRVSKISNENVDQQMNEVIS